MHNKYILFLLIFILFPSLAQAGGYEKTITKIGDSQVPNGKMQISADGKFLYVCNTNGNFAKFDIEKGEVVDTFSITNEDGISLGNIIVDRTGTYLIQQVCYNERIDSIFTYDLVQKKKIGSISISNKLNGDFDYLAMPYFSFFYTQNDSVLAISMVGYGAKGNGNLTSGGMCFYNFLANTLEVSSLITNKAITQVHYSNNFKRLIISHYRYNTGHSTIIDVSNTISGFSVFDNNNLVRNINYDYSTYATNGIVTSISGERMNSLAVDNTNNQIFFTTDKNIFRVYSIKDSAYIFEEQKNLLTYNFIFPPSDFYYFGYSYNGVIYVFNKQNHILIDTIQSKINNINAQISSDSTNIYIMNDSGGIYKINYELMDNAKKIGFNTLNKQIQLGDTIQIFDLSIGVFISRKWIVNGVESADTAKVLKYVPETKGLYSVELERQSGDSTYRKTEVDLFSVFERTKADFTFQSEDFQDSLGVSFTNLSLGDSLYFKWLFGDGATSEEMNPYHYYTKKGIYTVRLIAYNNYFADTVLSKEEIYFEMKNILDITQKSNRNFGVSKYLVSGHANPFGINGFWMNNKICGYNMNIYQNYNNDLSIDSKSFQINSDIVIEMLSNNIHYDLFKSIEFRIYPIWVNDSIYFLTANRQFNYDSKHVSYFEYYKSNANSNKKEILFERYTETPEFSLNSFNLRLNEDLIFLSINYFDKNKSPKSDFLKININTLEKDSITIDFKFNFGLPDHENGKIKLVSEQDNKASIYEYSEALGLQKLFDLDNMDSILFVDQNLKRNRMLFVSKGRKATDTTLTLTITDFSGNTLGTRMLDNMKLIRDIKFTDNFILISPYYGKVDEYNIVFHGNVDLIVYDYNGSFIDVFHDNYIYNGYINSITHLSANKALLVGTKFQKFDYIQNKGVDSQSELYYIVDLDKIVSVPNDDPGKIDVPSIRCSPNPTNGDITFNFENVDNQIVLLKIIDPMGNELATLETSSDFASFPAAGLGSGIYFVKAVVGSKLITGKFVVAR